MAHFYGSMIGARGETTRTGTKASGIDAHVRSWTHGIRAGLFCTNELASKDEAIDRGFIEITSGSAQDGRTASLYISETEFDSILEGRAVLAVVPVDADEGLKNEG